MAISRQGQFQYSAVLQRNLESWKGSAHDDGLPSLLGSGPSVAVTEGRVTLTRSWRGALSASLMSAAAFEVGGSVESVLREGDLLSCWRTGTAEIGLSVTRNGSLELGLGVLHDTPAVGITIEHDPRVEETELARKFRYIDQPGSHIVWLDPQRPRELEAGLRELDGELSGVKVLAIVVRSDSDDVRTT
jgi:hypothetical protein